MVNIKEAKEDKATVVGIIFIGMGSSWYQGSDDVKVAVQCAKICKQDWKHLFKFERNHAFPVNLYDLTNKRIPKKKIENELKKIFEKNLSKFYNKKKDL